MSGHFLVILWFVVTCVEKWPAEPVSKAVSVLGREMTNIFICALKVGTFKTLLSRSFFNAGDHKQQNHRGMATHARPCYSAYDRFPLKRQTISFLQIFYWDSLILLHGRSFETIEVLVLFLQESSRKREFKRKPIEAYTYRTGKLSILRLDIGHIICPVLVQVGVARV